MEKPITLTVTSAQTRAEIRDTITAGDSDAYPLSIIFSDLTAITGNVRFRFVRGDNYWDRDATVAGNVASLMLEPAFYAATGTELWVSFEDSNLYTPLHVYFRDIRVPGGNVEASTSQTYPQWVTEVAEAEADRVEAESARDDAEVLRMGAESDRMDAEVLRKSAEADRVTAEANRAVWETFDPLDVYAVGNKVYYLGSSYIMHTVSGVAGTLPTDTDYWAIIAQKGDAGEMTIGTVTTLAPGESATVTNSGTSTDAVLDIAIPAGYDGSALQIDDASSAADRVLSASYIKGQLAAIDAEIAQTNGLVLRPKKNLLNKETALVGFSVNQADGTIFASASLSVSDYILIRPNATYSRYPVGNRVAFYDINKVFISGTNIVGSSIIQTPANSVYMRCTLGTTNLDNAQIELGDVNTTVEEYEEVINDAYVPEITLPLEMYGLVGKEINIYFDNILSDRAERYDIDVVHGTSAGIQQEDRFVFTPTVAGSHVVTINVYKNKRLINSKRCAIIVKDTTVGNAVTKKCLFIGDSTTSAGVYTGEVLTLFGADVMAVTLLGTKGTAPNLYEAVAGWSTNTVYTDASSPFVFAGVFNFAQYISTNSIDAPDYVIINLGINDIFGLTTDSAVDAAIASMLTQYLGMVTSIKAYSSAVKIGIALTIPASYSQDAFGHDAASGQVQWQYKINNNKLVRALIGKFQGVANVYLVPIHANLDTKNNMSVGSVAVNSRNATLVTRQDNAVHPANSGYYQIADVFYYWLKSFET